MDIRGNQPTNGTMQYYTTGGDLDGYPGVGYIQINYSFPDGVQTVGSLYK